MQCSHCGRLDSSFYTGSSLRWTPAQSARAGRQSLCVEAKRVTKKTDIVLAQDVMGLGTKGTVTKAPYGYFRNYLLPMKLAMPLTDNYLALLEKEEKQKKAIYSRGVAKAQAMATALKTIGKFTITKRAGAEGKIFGSVTAQEVIDAINKQTGQTVEKSQLRLPDLKTVGNHKAEVQLHPDVIGTFNIVIAKAKQS